MKPQAGTTPAMRITAAVMLIAVFVVKQHVDSRAGLDEARLPVLAASAQAIMR